MGLATATTRWKNFKQWGQAFQITTESFKQVDNVRYITRHDDVIKWKHFRVIGPLCWEFHRSPVDSPHKGQWRGALMFSMICALINGWVNNREAGDLRRHCAHYDVIVTDPTTSDTSIIGSANIAFFHKINLARRTLRIACTWLP